jgi:hypothetical protein
MPPERAGIAQLVERNLAKVEVASSRLVSRSTAQAGKPGKGFPDFLSAPCRAEASGQPLDASAAGWQSGHAADCKSVYAGSIPTPASSNLFPPVHSSASQ